MPDRLAAFFAQYPNFDYDPDKSAATEFYRLCDDNGWDREDDEREVAKAGFDDALTMQFNDNYGTNVNDLTTWQALCARLRMNPVPTNLYDCREAVRSKPVNLVDLVDNFNTRKKVRLFPTVEDLSIYTKNNGKFFPKDNAHAGNLLKFLLRQIMHPELTWIEGRRTHGRGRRKGQGHGQGQRQNGQGRGHAHDRGRAPVRGRSSRRGCRGGL